MQKKTRVLLSLATLAISATTRPAMAEEEDGPNRQCKVGTYTAFFYCADHYAYADCVASRDWTLNQCDIQFPT